MTLPDGACPDGRVRVGAPDPTEWQGSNAPIDLPGEGEDIRRTLSALSHLQDLDLELLDAALREVPARRQELRAVYGGVLDRLLREGKSATAAKALAEAECRSAMRALENAQAARELAAERLRAHQSQLTAAQTRAGMWNRLWDLEVRR